MAALHLRPPNRLKRVLRPDRPCEHFVADLLVRVHPGQQPVPAVVLNWLQQLQLPGPSTVRPASELLIGLLWQ